MEEKKKVSGPKILREFEFGHANLSLFYTLVIFC
jgi:hypothetical protein